MVWQVSPETSMSALQLNRPLFPNKKFTFCNIVPFPTVIGRVEICVFGSLGTLMIVSILVVLEAITKHCAVTRSVAKGAIPPKEGGVPRHEIRHTGLQMKGPATDLPIRVFLIFLAVLPCAICVARGACVSSGGKSFLMLVTVGS